MELTEMTVAGRFPLAKRFAKTARKGLTLIEAAMVLAILALVVAGIMLFYTSANSSRLTTKALGDLGNIQQSVRSLYGGQASYTGLTNQVLIDAKALPSSMVSGTTLRHAFNGTVSVAAATVGGVDGFSVTFTNVPDEACTKMASQDLGRGLIDLKINSTAMTLPATPGVVSGECKNGSNTIAWTFN